MAPHLVVGNSFRKASLPRQLIIFQASVAFSVDKTNKLNEVYHRAGPAEKRCSINYTIFLKYLLSTKNANIPSEVVRSEMESLSP